MTAYMMCLDDSLLQSYLEFKSGKINSSNIFNLINYLRMPFLTNKRQLKSLCLTGRDDLLIPFVSLFQQLPHLQQLDLVTLSNETVYKLILSENNNTLPFANINQTSIANTFTITVLKGESRDEIKKYLKLILSNATNIFIYDKFFNNNWDKTKELFSYLKANSVTVNLPNSLFNKKIKTAINTNISLLSAISTDYPNCHVINNNSNPCFANKSHDRFIIVDNKIELIFSSGIDNFFDPNLNECTLIIRAL